MARPYRIKKLKKRPRSNKTTAEPLIDRWIDRNCMKQYVSEIISVALVIELIDTLVFLVESDNSSPPTKASNQTLFLVP
jgi:hypothetical protein